MLLSGEICLTQENGDLPITLAGGAAPGESGISLYRMRFRGGAHFSAIPQRHLIWFKTSSPAVRLECRIDGTVLTHEPQEGSLAICPAGIDSGTDGVGDLEAMVVVIEPDHLALAAAEGSLLDARLM